jgi:hypothetical protein
MDKQLSEDIAMDNVDNDAPLPAEDTPLPEEDAVFAEKDAVLLEKAKQWKWEIPIPL